jgi:6-phosphofructokinase 1
VVTCGGLCPGLNAVIYGIVNAAKHLYNVDTVYGIRGGYHGFYNWSNMEDPRAPMVLTEDKIRGIQVNTFFAVVLLAQCKVHLFLEHPASTGVVLC